jgi:hypothetical protein
MPRPTPATLVVLLLILVLAATALAEQPRWSFSGQLPAVFQRGQRIPDGHFKLDPVPVDSATAASALTVQGGEPVVLIRAGEVVARGRVGEIFTMRHPDATGGRLVFFRPTDLEPDVPMPVTPPGPAALDDANYDVWVLTEAPVEVLAPDPSLQDIAWGDHDYCVRVGRLRFAIIREKLPTSTHHRGWQVRKLDAEGGSLKVSGDYTWRDAMSGEDD